jgi:hypothetical protein
MGNNADQVALPVKSMAPTMAALIGCVTRITSTTPELVDDSRQQHLA